MRYFRAPFIKQVLKLNETYMHNYYSLICIPVSSLCKWQIGVPHYIRCQIHVRGFTLRWVPIPPPLFPSPDKTTLGLNAFLLRRTELNGDFLNWHKTVLLTLTDPRTAAKKGVMTGAVSPRGGGHLTLQATNAAPPQWRCKLYVQICMYFAQKLCWR